MLKQRVGEARFGLDAAEAPASSAATTWDDLSWGNLATTADELKALEYIDLSAPLENVAITAANNPDGVTWGANSADMAYVLYQDPMLIAVHADEMVPGA